MASLICTYTDPLYSWKLYHPPDTFTWTRDHSTEYLNATILITLLMTVQKNFLCLADSGGCCGRADAASVSSMSGEPHRSSVFIRADPFPRAFRLWLRVEMVAAPWRPQASGRSPMLPTKCITTGTGMSCPNTHRRATHGRQAHSDGIAQPGRNAGPFYLDKYARRSHGFKDHGQKEKKLSNTASERLSMISAWPKADYSLAAC